jgi:hypothetical protein
MDANLRRTHSCQFAFIRGWKPSWAGWINHEWTRMNANLRRTHSCQFASIRGFNPGGPVRIKPRMGIDGREFNEDPFRVNSR